MKIALAEHTQTMQRGDALHQFRELPNLSFISQLMNGRQKKQGASPCPIKLNYHHSSLRPRHHHLRLQLHYQAI
jgi:hypothetical protein